MTKIQSLNSALKDVQQPPSNPVELIIGSRFLMSKAKSLISLYLGCKAARKLLADLVIVFVMLTTFCQNTKQQQTVSSQINTMSVSTGKTKDGLPFSVQDSVKIVTVWFLTLDDFTNSFVVSNRYIEEVYHDHKKGVLRYFPGILNSSDINLFSHFAFTSYLCLEQNRFFLKYLWQKNKEYAGDSGKGISTNNKFKPIVQLLSDIGIKHKYLNS
jgi:hypothetical protein